MTEPALMERTGQWNEDSVAREFADEFAVDPDDVFIDERRDFGVDYFEVEVNRREYLVFADDDAAKTFAVNRVAEDLEDDPSLFNQDWLQSHVYISDTDKRLIAQEEADDYAYEVLSDDDAVSEAGMEDEYDNAVDADDYDKQARIISDAREEVADTKWREIQQELRDPIQYFVHDRGIYTVEQLMDQSWVQIDTGEAAEEAVRMDSAAHFLARYDGDEQETAEGLMYYRTN
jgi:hypothetical protein